MDKVKKISSIIAAIFVIAVFVVLPCFADSVTTAADSSSSDPDSSVGTELHFGSPFYAFTGYFDPTLDSGEGGWIYNRNFTENYNNRDIVSFPTDFFRSSYSGGASSSKEYFCYGVTGTIVDENGIISTLHDGWSYRIIINIDYKISVGDADFPGPTRLGEHDEDSVELWATSNAPTGNGSTVFSPVGLMPLSGYVSNYSVSAEMLTYTNDGSYGYTSWAYSFVFNFPESEEGELHTLNYLSYVERWYNNAVQNGTPRPSWNQPVRFKVADISGVYDPTGDSTDELESEADQIIQGQKEAAQYALDQEQAANEEALQAALDGSNTDGLNISNTFGNSLIGLYNALNYNGTNFSFKLPASGTVPFLNTQLWSETEIPIKDYIDKVPRVIWIVINFLLWFLVVRSVIKLVHTLIDIINGGNYN